MERKSCEKSKAKLSEEWVKSLLESFDRFYQEFYEETD